MDNIRLQEIIEYTRHSSGRVEAFGRKQTEPILICMDSITPDSDPADVWLACLSQSYSKNPQAHVRRLILALENHEVISDKDFMILDAIMQEEKDKGQAVAMAV